MSTLENILAGYDDTSKEGQLVIQRVKTLPTDTREPVSTRKTSVVSCLHS